MKLNPEEVAQAMVTPEWAALVRLDVNLAQVATWDPKLIRHPRLLVPVDLQALFVAADSDETFVKLPFALTSPDGQEPAAMPPPFAEGTPRPPGVHLHWALPDSLLSGELNEVDNGSRNRLSLPSLPDRWVVLRMVVPTSGNRDQVRTRGWVIEADTTRVTPLEDWPQPRPEQTGRTLTLDELNGSAGGSLNWTGVYDATENRFALHDPLEGLDTGALGSIATYVVAGWWSDAERDPLDAVRSKSGFSQRLNTLGWQVLGDREGGADLSGQETVTAARRATLGLGTAQRFGGPPPANESLADTAFRLQAYDPVFSVFAEEQNMIVKPARPKHLYSTLLHGTIYGVPVSGRGATPDQRPRANVTGTAFGVHGDDVVAAFASEGLQISNATERRDTERILAAFTGQRLDELGTADGVINVEEHEHASGFESRPGPPEAVEQMRVTEGDPFPAGRTARAQAARASRSQRGLGDSGKRQEGDFRLFFQTGERGNLKGGRTPDDQRGERAAWTKKALGDDPVQRSREVTRPGPRYHRALEPVVAIRNAKRSLRHRNDGNTTPEGRLLCRWPTQVQLRMEGVVEADDLLPNLPGSGVPPEVLGLARSAVVLDPYKADWLAQQSSRQKSLPQEQAAARINAEVALRWNNDASYSAALPVGQNLGQTGGQTKGTGERYWAGAKVTDQFRRFSLVDGVDTDPIGITAWSQPWVPLWLEWEVEVTATDQLAQTRLETLDLEPEDPAWIPPSPPRMLTGRSQLNTGAAKTLASAVDDWLLAETARDADNAGEADEATEAALGNISDAIDTLDVLSATLDSLQEQLLGLPIGDYGVLNARVGLSSDLDKPVPVDVPQLMLNGVLRLNRARIVDAFGRVLALNMSRTRIPARTSVPGAPPATLRVNPRLNRPARWLFRLVDPADLSATSRPATVDQVVVDNTVNPVAGYLLPDHIDEALEFFDTSGTPLGQLMHEPFGGGVVWEIAPGRPGPVDAGPLHDLQPAQMPLGFMAAAQMAVDAQTREGQIAPPEAESTLSAMLRAIDTTLWTVDTFAGLGNANIAGLVGRPIAVVRAVLRLDIDDDLDELNLSDADLKKAREDAYKNLADRAFPVRIGELTRSDDGVLGFFVDDNYTRFHVVDKAVRDGALDSGRGRGHLAQRGSTSQIPDKRPIDHPYIFAEDQLEVHPGQAVRLTILMHPAARAHLTSGLLPRKSLQLIRDWTHHGLSVIAPSTRIGPVLIEPGEVRLPKISVFPKGQIWTRRDSPITWKSDPILAATQTALLPDTPAEVQEGYIRIDPDQPDDEETP